MMQRLRQRAQIRQFIARFWSEVIAAATESAETAITNTFKAAWRGDKFQWPHLQMGHGYELTQHGTYTFTITEVPANTDVGTAHALTYPLAYASGEVPDVQAQSQTSGWVAFAAPHSGAEETQLDLWVERLKPLADQRETDYQNATILAGNHDSSVGSVTYPTPFQSAPSLSLSVQTVTPNSPSGTPTGIGAVDYVAVIQGQDAAGFSYILYYRPAFAASLTTADAATGVTVANGNPSPNQSGDNADLTTDMYTVGGAHTPSSVLTDVPSTNTTSAGGTAATGNGSTGHVHQENTAATYTQNANTAGAGATHTHTGPSHTHDMANHTHITGNHVHNMNNHHHDLGNHGHTATVTDPQHHHSTTITQPVVGSDQSRAVTWVAIGALTATADTPVVSWQACAIQPS